MEFIQIIEFSTTRLADVEALMDEWVTKTEGRRKVQRALLTADRDRPNTYVQVVQFPDHEQAMENSNLPETAELAEKVGGLCDGPPTFRNLDVRRVDDLG
jgi:hypothetical protein